MSMDFRENIDPVFAKILAKMESKIFAKIVRKSRNFFLNERKSRNFLSRKSSFAIFVGNPKFKQWKIHSTKAVLSTVSTQYEERKALGSLHKTLFSTFFYYFYESSMKQASELGLPYILIYNFLYLLS